MKKILFSIVALLGAVLPLGAQTCDPTASFSYFKEGVAQTEEYGGEAITVPAPALGSFKANPQNLGSYDARYEWKIYNSLTPALAVVHRFDEDFEYTFTSSGSYIVELAAIFTLAGDTIAYPDFGEQPKRFAVNVSASLLEMPNAFSPNGDGHNDIYRAKPNHQSIISFRATIFNRWGQKLYSWNDVNGGWDGKVNGKTVKDGVYYVNVVAKGADGFEYKIRKDVNVLTGYDREEGSSNP